MASVTEPHRHCKICGTVVGVDELVCSKACRLKREEKARARRNLNYLLYGGMALLVLITVFAYVR